MQPTIVTGCTSFFTGIDFYPHLWYNDTEDYRMKRERLYGNYQPIPAEVQAVIDNLYENFEKGLELEERKIAYSVAADDSLINQDMLFAGANAINDAYMMRNTHPVFSEITKAYYRSLKIRDFKDDKLKFELLEFLHQNKDKVKVVMKNLDSCDYDKRNNFEINYPKLYMITEGEFAGLCFCRGKVDGKPEIFLDIANTPFEKLPKSWQESNFDPFEFAYKLVTNYPKLSLDKSAAAVHVYWLSSNMWAIKDHDKMGVPYSKLDRAEQVKDEDNVVVGKVFRAKTKSAETIGKETCRDIVRIVRDIISSRIDKNGELEK